MNDILWRIKYHDEVACYPGCGEDISTYSKPPAGWRPGMREERLDNHTEKASA